MKIAIACDHGAFEFKGGLLSHLELAGHEVVDLGTHSSASCDYPDYAFKATDAVLDGLVDRAILSCTNGIGMSMVANKVSGIRAALVYSEKTAAATRRHHDSNVLCLGADEFSQNQLLRFVDIWLSEKFEGDRHARRIAKFPI